MKSLKKITCIILVAALFLGAFVNCTSTSASVKKDQKKIVESLKEATKYCKELSTTLYYAWSFFVYKYDDFDSYYDDEEDAERYLTKFSMKTGIPKYEVIEIIQNNLDRLGIDDDPVSQADYITELDNCLGIVYSYYYRDYTIDLIDSDLNLAKVYMKSLPDNAKKKKLNQYYKTVKKYYNFLGNSKCNYKQFNKKRKKLLKAVNKCYKAIG